MSRQTLFHRDPAILSSLRNSQRNPDFLAKIIFIPGYHHQFPFCFSLNLPDHSVDSAPLQTVCRNRRGSGTIETGMARTPLTLLRQDNYRVRCVMSQRRQFTLDFQGGGCAPGAGLIQKLLKATSSSPPQAQKTPSAWRWRNLFFPNLDIWLKN